MINGEGTRETPPEATPLDLIDETLPWQCQESDGGGDSPTFSQYSSCGESEFDRYCSANSAIGTPSFSSVGTFQDCLDSEFGSGRSFGLEGVGSMEKLNLGGRIAENFGERRLSASSVSGSLSNHRIESCEGRDSSEVRSDSVGQGFGPNDGLYSSNNGESFSWHGYSHGVTGNMELSNVGSEPELPEVMDLNTTLDDRLCIEDDGGSIVQWSTQTESIRLESSDGVVSDHQTNSTDVIEENNMSSRVNGDTQSFERVEVDTHCQTNIELGNNYIDGLVSSSDVEFGRREDGRCSDEDEASSRFDHSEGEDSMYGYTTNDEQKMGFFHQRDMHSHNAAKSDKENPLLMSSSIAFGSEDWDDFVQEAREPDMSLMMSGNKQPNIETNLVGSSSQTDTSFLGVGPEQEKVLMDMAMPSCKGQGTDEVGGSIRDDSLTPLGFLDLSEIEQGKDAEDIRATTNQAGDPDELSNYLKICSGSHILEGEQYLPSQEARLQKDLDFVAGNLRKDPPLSSTQDCENDDAIRTLECQELEKSTVQLDHLSDIKDNLPLCSAATESPKEKMVDFHREPFSSVPPNEKTIKRPQKNSLPSVGVFENHHNAVECPLTIDGVEVIGAKQKQGDISFGERLVGVKEYTVYVIRVWSGKDFWEVERRYRDFCTLHRRLKTFFAGQGWILPSPWSLIERESRKIFGNVSPDVVAERSALIQECLQSILLSKYPSGLPSALFWFLSLPKVGPGFPASDTPTPQSPFSARGAETGNMLTLGKTISLIVEIRPHKSVKEILEAQHYTCAGCHKHFDNGKSRMLEFVQTLGWGKPRLCEYTGQLFCSSCHMNETAVLPARVLHNWDFTQHPVSQLAKSYLDSIHDQPMLCVSAVNPFLFAKVSALLQVTGVRKRIRDMLPYVRCPFRMSIYKGLASRRYILESNDFFALRDLVDLSKGVFAALPVMVDTVSKKILEHITEQCLLCCDAGVPCNARQACNDPSSLIFPFQEGEIERCRSCNLVFHKPCFRKIKSCPCGELLNHDGEKGGSTSVIHRIESDLRGATGMFGKKTDSKSGGFLSGLFTKGKPAQLLGSKDSDTVILMGSLPAGSSL
ncbi:uncharacterized protein LOC127794452 isoform X2 [Diospyros lotus]|uniref:uncharacterized protein LOC127794452 isoform X2 n=1 Tax=Diospyros lotus TaxID=55363 RepID=UPI0022501411|nr:uncharacterized protein LOC127794452 isoform X2 [Diospyros lotus]